MDSINSRGIIKVALYDRSSVEVSSHQQQLRMAILKHFADSKLGVGNYLITDAYADNGYSGVSVDRPALSKALNDADTKAWDILVVRNMSVLSRNVCIFGVIQDILNTNNKTLIFVEEGDENQDLHQSIANAIARTENGLVLDLRK